MILRILGEGQFEVADVHLPALNAQDDVLGAALESGDETRFRAALIALLAEVRALGARVPDDSLLGSDVVLPGDDATLEEVRDMLGDEGLVPG